MKFWWLRLPRRGREEDLERELRSHIEAEAEEQAGTGVAPEEARYAARRALGNTTQIKGAVRMAWGFQCLETLLQDARYGLRQLRRDPGFTTVAVLSLALGIGANALVFSVVNALLLRPLPVANPGQLVFLENKDYGPGQSFPNYLDLRDRNRTFAGLAGYRISPMELETSSGAQRIWGYLATGNYFDVLGVRPALGRFFHQSDDLHPGASPYVVLSYNAWRSTFGAGAGIVGKVVRINRMPYTVLGVAPPDFHGAERWYWPEVWVPMMMEPQIEVGDPWLNNRNTWNTWVIGRLKPNTSAGRAEADLNTIGAELARQYPLADSDLQFRLAKPGLVGDAIGGAAKAFTLGVLGLAALVLLAACTNLASLLTARTTDRQRELALRLAIGAGRGRIIRQVLTETGMLSAAGGAAGYVLALLLAHALTHWRAPMDFPVQFNVNPDWRVFLFAAAAATVAGALFGCVPAWRASKTDPNTAFKGTAPKLGVGRVTLRDGLIVVQMALCFVLISGCLLSLNGLQQALKMNLGFEPRHVSVVAFDLGLAGYSEERGRSFQQRALEAVRALPGVKAAAYSNSVPLSLDQSTTAVFPGDKPGLQVSDGVSAIYYQVSPNFFSTVGTRLLAGRDFSWHEDAKSPRVAIVNLAFAKRVLHTPNPVGKRFRNGLHGRLVEVVGVVENGKYRSLTESQQPVVFWPILQDYNSTTALEVRSPMPAAEMVREMRQTIARLDPELPLYGAGSLDQMLGLAFLPTRAAALALSAFGLLAIMLAATGIHGIVAYAVSRRTREIGIRIALGARSAEVLRLVLGRIVALIAMGSAMGLLLALASAQVLASVVYEASPRDPRLLACVVAGMALLGVGASWAPVRRAMQVDPTVALRYE
ncbi:MAG TPA: ABC transporter permease [Terriglobia bacterium]|nr:ABC transporter permease [Terriglobia bacterium]